MVIRLALLSHHYREDWMWTEHELDHAAERLDRWREAVRLDAGLNADEVLVQVRSALAHDLDAPTALAAVDAWAGASTAIDGTTPTPRPGGSGLRRPARRPARLRPAPARPRLE